MDTMGALALATEYPHPDLLLEKPHGRTENLINKKMWVSDYGTRMQRKACGFVVM